MTFCCWLAFLLGRILISVPKLILLKATHAVETVGNLWHCGHHGQPLSNVIFKRIEMSIINELLHSLFYSIKSLFMHRWIPFHIPHYLSVPLTEIDLGKPILLTDSAHILQNAGLKVAQDNDSSHKSWICRNLKIDDFVLNLILFCSCLAHQLPSKSHNVALWRCSISSENDRSLLVIYYASWRGNYQVTFINITHCNRFQFWFIY